MLETASRTAYRDLAGVYDGGRSVLLDFDLCAGDVKIVIWPIIQTSREQTHPKVALLITGTGTVQSNILPYRVWWRDSGERSMHENVAHSV